jgi:hypothetical protein
MHGAIYLAIVLLAAALAGPPKAPTTRSADSDAQIARLISQLGHEDPAVRDQASTQLGKMLDSALPALKQAAQSQDPETAARAQALIDITESLPADVRNDLLGWTGGFKIDSATFQTEIENRSAYSIQAVVIGVRVINHSDGKDLWRRVVLRPLTGPIAPGRTGTLNGNVGEILGAEDNCTWNVELIRGKKAR